ncbi:alpha/beta fold hydrolase [Streptomyces sp. NPDC086077]|uniref:alpha/beta fold hydrolase n=1 Tax=Streptomyces sp. NPDC086077 TaxID=3154862 RepID=UPI003447510B
MASEVNPASTVLLVHGAWHGAWCWEKLSPELVAMGWQVETVALPSASADDQNDAGMYDDARVIRERLQALDGPVVVVGHSYGAIPMTEAAVGSSNVSRLIYLSAFMLEAGDSIDSLGGGKISTSSVVTLSAHGHYEDPKAAFYADVSAPDAERAVDRLVLQSAKSFCEPLTGAAWTAIPSSYVITDKDAALDVGFQAAMSQRAQRSYHLESGHSSFLSMPAELARLIDRDAKS